jgi:hypothetical protein
MKTEIIDPEIVTDAAPLATREIQDINSLHRLAHGAAAAARQKAAEASHYAILAGTRLESLQESLPHGEWGRLFSDRKSQNLTPNAAQIGECAAFEFSVDTARRYINLVKNLRAEQNLSVKANKRLSAIAEAPEIDEESRNWLEKLTEGRNLRQLYLDLEIITSREKSTPENKQPPAPRKSQKQAQLEDAREYWATWRANGERLVRIGSLDNLDKAGLLEMKEFQGWLRDRINARLSTL